MEVPLTGGNVADRVVRVGDTVRKPVTAATPAVTALLEHLAAAGFPAAPRPLGHDAAGRQVLEYVPGRVAEELPRLTVPELHRLGALIRDLHDLLATFEPPPGARWATAIPPDATDLVCHHDLAPWNLIRDGARWVFIDWDNAGPGSRLWDLGYAAQTFVPLVAGGDPAADAARLRAVVDGYGLGGADRRRLPTLMGVRTRAMYDLLRDGAETGTQPWARLYAEGHGDHWGPAADYVDRHRAVWLTALTGGGEPA